MEGVTWRKPCTAFFANRQRYSLCDLRFWITDLGAAQFRLRRDALEAARGPRPLPSGFDGIATGSMATASISRSAPSRAKPEIAMVVLAAFALVGLAVAALLPRGLEQHDTSSEIMTSNGPRPAVQPE